MPNIDAALSYAARGWPVVPVHTPTGNPAKPCSCHNPDCGNIGKHPRTMNGVKDATTDADQIRKWWGMWSDANIGIATGAASGVFVLDVDKHGEDGMATLAALEAAHGDLPQTVTSATGGGGFHYYFKMPLDGGSVRDRTKFVPGLDVCAGRLVVAAPSLHGSGSAYAWLDGLGPDDIEPSEAPAWLRELIAGRPDRAPAVPGQASPSSRYGIGALNRAVGEVFNAPQGSRNDVLNRQAFGIGQIMAAEAIDYDVAEATLVRVGVANGLTEQDAAATVRSGLGSGMANPRQQNVPVSMDDDLLTPDDIEAMPPVEWLIEGYLPCGGLSMLVGAPGVGKSFLAIAMALSVATGVQFDGKATKQGHVVYVAPEGVRGFKTRFPAWRAQYGVDRLTNIWVYRRPLNLMEPSQVEAFTAFLNKKGIRPTLTILDTFARCSLDCDENSSRDVGRAIDTASILQRDFGAAVMLVHHTIKGGGSGGVSDVERGSGALKGAADTAFLVKTDGDYLKLTCTKQKDDEDGWHTTWGLQHVGDSLVAVRYHGLNLHTASDGGQEARKAKKVWSPNANQIQALEVIRQAGTEGITKPEAVKQTGLERGTAYGCIDALTREGLVVFNSVDLRYRSAEVSVSGLDGGINTPRPTPTTRQHPVGPVGIEEPDTPTQALELDLMPVGSALVGLCKNSQPDNACRDSIPTPNPTNPKANSDGHSAA